MGGSSTLKAAGLLLFMLGATNTVSGPDVAPAGIVALIEPALHELTTSCVPFRSARLLPCEVPKPDPEIETSYPGSPVVGQMLLMTGEADAAELRETLSKVAVLRGVFAVLLTAGPMYTFFGMGIVGVLTISVQRIAACGTVEGNRLPLRTNLFPAGVGVLA